MDIKVKSNWNYQGKQQNGCIVKDVPQKVIDGIKKTVPPVEFDEVKGEAKTESKK
jgi:hypothetical protein